MIMMLSSALLHIELNGINRAGGLDRHFGDGLAIHQKAHGSHLLAGLHGRHERAV